MVSAATEYRKNGFNDQDAAQLARVSSMFQNVADESISTGDAAQFLISQLIAFNKTTGDVEGNAMHIADALNEVANNFAVGTGDLATGLKVVASSSAGMNNSFEQTIGLMTAITEQTKNASKASRGLNSIMANLAQVLDDASSNGKKITEIFEQLGVEMYENGQLKSGYDLLAGLAEKWDTLDNNSQKYIATTVAGTTQLNNFLALMNNFDHAVGATNKALDSQGSAMRENSAYMESIQAKLSQLQSTFQDFANNVITSDLAKAVLDLANGLLQIANTDLGQIVAQIVLLTGLGWGATSLTKALGIFKVGIEQFKILGQVAGAAGAAGGITSVADAFAALSLAGGAALPIILGVATVLAVGGALWKATEDSRKSFEELKTEIGDTNDKLQTNKERLKEINALPWNERTQEILNEKDALEKENEELQAQIDKLETLSKKKAKQALNGGYVTGDKIQVSGITGQYAGRFDAGLQGQSFETYEELVKYLDNYIPGASKKTRQELEALGVQFETVQGQVYKTGEAYEQDLIQQANELSNKLKTNHQLTDEDLEQYNEVTSKLDTLAQAHQLVGDESTAARDALDGLNLSYKNAVEYTQKYGEASTESSRKVTDLVNSLAVAASQSGKTKEAFYQLVASEKVFNNTSLNVSEKIAALQQLAQQAGITGTLLTASSTTTHDQMSGYIRTQRMKGMSESQARQSYLQSIYKEFMSFTPTIPTSVDGGGGSKGKSSKSSATKQYTDKALKQFKSLQKDIEHQLNLGEITEEEYYAKLEGLVKQYKTNATAHMKEYGLNVNQINQNMYQYEEEIYKGRAKLAENLKDQQKKAAEEAAQAEKEALEQQRSDYEKAVDYIVDKIDEQISKLEQQKSDIEKFYDDQIQALQDTNDELERQIQYEQLLNNLAQAKDKGLYVFSNGQFQYMQDVEAISAAQAELDAYERDEVLRKEVENLNKLKDQAIASIDAQIEKWEEYKEEWSNVVTQYDEEQNKLLASQLLGIDTEKANWETRLANAQNFANKYNSIMASLDAASSAATSGDGYSFSGAGTGGWTEAEMKAGFISSSSSSRSSRKSVDSMRSEANAALAKSKATGKKVSLGGGVSIDYSKVKKHAGGTLSAQAGLSLVGEQGPELRVLGQGDGVIPADVTRNLWNWGKINPSAIASNMNNIFNIDNLILPNARDAQTLIAGLKQMAYQRAYKRA
nr:MAG TPA: tail tape measure protein [Caudoviricetes sp.]